MRTYSRIQQQTGVVDTVTGEVNEWSAVVVIECSALGAAIRQAIGVANEDVPVVNRNVMSVGVQEELFEIKYFSIHEDEVTVSGDHQRSELREILDHLEAQKISLEQLVTHTVPLEDIDRDIELIDVIRSRSNWW